MRPADIGGRGGTKTVIERVMTYHMGRDAGLDYAAFMHEASATPLAEVLRPRFHEALAKIGLPGTQEAQDDWRARWRALHRALRDGLKVLDRAFEEAGHGSLVRGVFDVDLGCVYLTRIGAHACVFGATVDQSQVNSRACEQELRRIVAEIETLIYIQGG